MLKSMMATKKYDMIPLLTSPYEFIQGSIKVFQHTGIEQWLVPFREISVC